MMIHAYSELYLDDAMHSLADCFDYAINTCKLDPDWFIELFLFSKKSSLFEHGNPWIVSGQSGIELAVSILDEVYQDKEFPKPIYNFDRSPEYWAGWALAQYQWYTARSFKDIFRKIKLSEIILMYNPYHEMDITSFIEAIEEKYNSIVLDTKLKIMRENRGYSQKKLSDLSGVSLRSIQLYEQRVNDIDKAQAHTLYKLALKLCCSIEDLLENPVK